MLCLASALVAGSLSAQHTASQRGCRHSDIRRLTIFTFADATLTRRNRVKHGAPPVNSMIDSGQEVTCECEQRELLKSSKS